jgi:hypothetical protein
MSLIDKLLIEIKDFLEFIGSYRKISKDEYMFEDQRNRMSIIQRGLQ